MTKFADNQITDGERSMYSPEDEDLSKGPSVECLEQALNEIRKKSRRNSRQKRIRRILKKKTRSGETYKIDDLLNLTAQEAGTETSQHDVAIELWDQLQKGNLKLYPEGVKSNRTESGKAPEKKRGKPGTPAQTRYSRPTDVESYNGIRLPKKMPDGKDREGLTDYDTILDSWAFRRLAGVTQITTPDPSGHLMRNRLTHSLKVAEVGRRIAESLIARVGPARACDEFSPGGGLDPDIVAAAGLAHDIGHPPFGHAGEEELDRLARLMGLEGFEGNAQTLRVLTRLEFRFNRTDGMRLTNATLAAVIKYPWLRPALANRKNHKWNKFNAYTSDRKYLEGARRAVGVDGETQTLEASIMDIADDITYALHDLEDFYTAGRFRRNQAVAVLKDFVSCTTPPSKYRNCGKTAHTPTSNEYEKLRDYAESKLEVVYREHYGKKFDENEFQKSVSKVENLIRFGMLRHFDGSRAAYTMVRTAFASRVNSYIDGVYVPDPDDKLGTVARLRTDHWCEIQVLKWLTKQYVIDRSELVLTQTGQKKLIEKAVRNLRAWCRMATARGLPVTLRELIDQEFRSQINSDPGLQRIEKSALKTHKENGRIDLRGENKDDVSKLLDALNKAQARAIIDYISSLTDAQLVSLAGTVSGTGAPSPLYYE